MAIMPSVSNVKVRERKVTPKDIKISDKKDRDEDEGVPRGVGGRFVMKDGKRIPRDED